VRIQVTAEHVRDGSIRRSLPSLKLARPNRDTWTAPSAPRARSSRGAERRSRAEVMSVSQADSRAGSCDNGMAGFLAGQR